METLILPPLTSLFIRACISCSYLTTATVFKSSGCPNCPFGRRSYLGYTSKVFEGVILILDSSSWVGKWQHLPRPVTKGYYAVTVEGVLPIEYIECIEDGGRNYIDRGKAFTL